MCMCHMSPDDHNTGPPCPVKLWSTFMNAVGFEIEMSEATNETVLTIKRWLVHIPEIYTERFHSAVWSCHCGSPNSNTNAKQIRQHSNIYYSCLKDLETGSEGSGGAVLWSELCLTQMHCSFLTALT